MCKNGIQGGDCSEVVPDFFIRSIDYLISEGEEATGVPNPVINLSNPNRLFTGFGYYGVIENVSVADFGYLRPPASGLYECVFRYVLSGAIRWNSSVLTITPSGEEGSGPVNCEGVPEVTGSLQMEYRNWQMGVGLSIFHTFCLRGGRSYQFVLSDFISGRNDDAANLMIDSLVLIPVHVNRPVFSDPSISAQYLSCVDQYRNLATRMFAPPSCRQTIFTVSADIYNGASGIASCYSLLLCLWKVEFHGFSGTLSSSSCFMQ